MTESRPYDRVENVRRFEVMQKLAGLFVGV
jgi:hypothetical protein